jgi:MYXO-CTERM domain-containing protein
MATNVPPNASLIAHYDISAEYVNESIWITPPSPGARAPHMGEFDSSEGVVTYKPEAPLEAGVYTVEWPSLRGLNAAAPGRGVTITFTVGTQPDVAAPSFDGLTSVHWALERQKNDCTDALESRFVFDFELAPADDDGGRDGLTLVVLQTAGGAVDGGGPVPVLARAMPAPGEHVVVKLPVADATGHVCFAALARDTTGQVSNSGSQEVCVETTAPPFFKGCAIAPSGSGRREAAVALLLMFTVLRRRRK